MIMLKRPSRESRVVSTWEAVWRGCCIDEYDSAWCIVVSEPRLRLYAVTLTC